MNATDFSQFLQQVCNIAIQAGLIINTYYKTKSEVSFKDDRSPLTEADLASNKFIINSLFDLDLDIPTLSEESLVNWDIRKNWTKYWLVDPLDGTKEFINQNGEFTVNIALIDNNAVVGEVINIGPDEEFVTINKIAEICSNITGSNLKPEYHPDRPKEVKHATCSSNKARKLLKYKTSTDLYTGIKKTFEYIKKRGPKKFNYHVDLEIVNDLTPKAWVEKKI